MKSSLLDLKNLRSDIIGGDSTFEIPFGEHLLTYCDYTASGRCLGLIENYLHKLQRIYANTHTEDDGWRIRKITVFQSFSRILFFLTTASLSLPIEYESLGSRIRSILFSVY